MLQCQQLIGVDFSSQHHPVHWVAERACAMGADRMEFWGVSARQRCLAASAPSFTSPDAA